MQPQYLPVLGHMIILPECICAVYSTYLHSNGGFHHWLSVAEWWLSISGTLAHSTPDYSFVMILTACHGHSYKYMNDRLEVMLIARPTTNKNKSKENILADALFV
ncbi:hypothetical protein KL86SPO_50087 [uncultured Sporomusa sp.]|uniref:Uncharacterized protein n=1 Tax=uncultured Sporomusa sp. TaxID=307249 RepID=A0A212LXT5_9FIRM|nr:hypothetical protein KL86SPO_50087 [uncultured Sporomusa sp.]